MNNPVYNNADCRGAVILAGGDSKRLGRPKALLDFNGLSLIELIIKRLNPFFRQITVVTDRPELFSGLPIRLSDDIIKLDQKSPLRGIHAGLKTLDLPYQFVTACDMPFLNLEMIKYMARFAADFDAVVPLIGNYYQPLHAFYSRCCAEMIEKQLRCGSYKVSDLYKKLNIRFLSAEEIMRFDPEQKSFFNINTWSDYERALALSERDIETI